MKLGKLMILGLILLLLACNGETPHETSPQIVTFPEPLKGVVVKAEVIPLYYEAVGTIAAKTSTLLSSKISGHIQKILVHEGDRVKAGDLLVVIDDRDVNARLNQARAAHTSATKALDEIERGIEQARAQEAQAEANLTLARATFRRYEKLYKDKAVSNQEFDTAKAKLQVAQAGLDAARQGVSQLEAKKEQTLAAIEQVKATVEEANINKSFTRITAPFDGVIVKKHVDVGSLAVPGLSLLTLENPKGFRLEVDVREKEFANKVRLGRDVDVQIDALGDQPLSGNVAEVVPSANPQSRTFQVKIALPETVGVKSGMYGKAMCLRGERRAILIPQSALIRRGQLEQVFTVDDQQIAHLRLVKSGKRFQAGIEILAGLDEGEIVIVNPKAGLKDRNRVKLEVQG